MVRGQLSRYNYYKNLSPEKKEAERLRRIENNKKNKEERNKKSRERERFKYDKVKKVKKYLETHSCKMANILFGVEEDGN